MFGKHNFQKRTFLTPAEVDQLLHCAKSSRYGLRDYAMMLLAYRHGLRVSELVEALRCDLGIEEEQVWVERKRAGLSVCQPLQKDEIRALREYLDTRHDSFPWLFLSSQRTRMTRQNFSYLIARASQRAGFGKLHPQILRGSCNQQLVTKGTEVHLAHEWLGHRIIRQRNLLPVAPET